MLAAHAIDGWLQRICYYKIYNEHVQLAHGGCTWRDGVAGAVTSCWRDGVAGAVSSCCSVTGGLVIM